MAEVRMPKMGDGMEEGTINVWLKQEGQTVTSGEPIAEIATDKANVEITAYETGTITRIVVPVGGTVPVGEVIAIIGSATAAVVGAGNGSGPEAGVASVSPEPQVAEAPKSASPVPAVSSPTSERVKSSPLARRMADELGIELARITGTGPGGRIVERDIKAYQSKRPATEAVPPIAVAPAPAEAPKPAAVSAAASQDIKPSKMREAIARRTVLSKQTIPHFFVTMVVEMDRAMAMLKELNADGNSKVTVNDLIVKACAIALGRVPEVNSTWTAEGIIRRYSEAHIGIAVGIDEGLIIPVVRNCEAKTLRQISAEAKTLIGKARNNQLTPAEYSGGTFSVSNLGMMGVDEFLAIINPPEAAILAIGGIVREPVVVENDDIVIKSRMKITISADHRVLDGVIAARFVQEAKKILESPFSLLS